MIRSEAAPMIKLTPGQAAVDHGYAFRSMDSCPRGTKVQLLNPGGVACYGTFTGETYWRGWAPLPKIPKELR